MRQAGLVAIHPLQHAAWHSLDGHDYLLSGVCSGAGGREGHEEQQGPRHGADPCCWGVKRRVKGFAEQFSNGTDHGNGCELL